MKTLIKNLDLRPNNFPEAKFGAKPDFEARPKFGVCQIRGQK